MQPGLKWTVAVLAALLLAYGSFTAYASYSNGHDVDATLVLGTEDGRMYIRCGPVSGAECSGGDRAVLTVHKRDRIHLHIHNDDGGDHTHDFFVEGWQYLLPPVSPEMELHDTDESWTFTAWASGTFHMLCELKGHEAAGMQGTFVVL